MRPDQFTMWLRGVLDAVGEGEGIPAETAKKVYDTLTEVVAGQVADRFREIERLAQLEKVTRSPYPPPSEAAMQIAQMKAATDLQIAQMKYGAPKK